MLAKCWLAPLGDPQTYNEKLQWLKLYDRKPEYTQMVDKYEAKKYVAAIIGEEYIIPTLGVWDRFEDIDFDALPDCFVLKCTHDSGGLVIVRDKKELDKKAARRKIEHCLGRNYYMNSREWPYKNVRPRIIAEQFMINDSGEELQDYKFMCFNGKVKCCFVCSDRFSAEGLHITILDRDWNVLPFHRHYHPPKSGLEKPAQYDEMLRLAEQLSKDIPFVRVDLYEINGKIYFGELTFFPGSGLEKFEPESGDYTLGSWIALPNRE